MKQLKRWCILGIFFVLAAGTLSHFLYDWTNKNFLIGFFTPVNESVWEHMKLLFFPMLLYSIPMAFQLKENNPCILSSLCAGILAGTLLLPLFFYGYTYLLGKDMLFLDLTDFALSVILAFFLVYKFTLSCRLQNYTASLCLAVCILFLCFVLFTSYPPDLPIFYETG